MIVTVVRIPNRTRVGREQHSRLARKSAPWYQKVPGLIRKYYLLSPQEDVAGGVYFWESREAAEECFASGWREKLIGTYGAEPEVAFFECPVTVDNALKKIETAA